MLIKKMFPVQDTEIQHPNTFQPAKTFQNTLSINAQLIESKSTALDICIFAEVLELPLSIVGGEIGAMAQFTEALMREISKQKLLQRTEGTWLAFQIAYLQALQQVINQEAIIQQRPWMIWDRGKRGVGEGDRGTGGQGEQGRGILLTRKHLFPHSDTQTLPLQDAQLQELLKTFRLEKLTDTEAEEALCALCDSSLVQKMNNATIAWFVANGAEEVEAKLITQRVIYAFGGHLLAIIAQNAAILAQLQKFVGLGNLLSSVSTNSLEFDLLRSDKIDLYRERYRASLLQKLSEPLFMESFALKDIYVPLKGLPGLKGQDGNKNTEAVDLMVWVQQQLADLETVAVIESEPGYGKSSFCQIFAALVAQSLYPTWMPVIIRLRDIKYGKNIEETLNSGLKGDFQIDIFNCQEQHPRYLLLLDGLDELPACRQGSMAKAIFLQQLLSFQAKSQHKVVLTSRSRTLQEIVGEIPLQLRRIVIKPLGVEELKQWFQKWASIQSLAIAQNFFTFLKQVGLLKSKSNLRESALVRQPLMLYLLGVLHRDGLLDEILDVNTQYRNSAAVLFEIYHRLSRWLLGYPLTGGVKTMLYRSGSAHIHRTPEVIALQLAGCHPEDLVEKMNAIALQILHSPCHQLPLTPEANINLPAFYFRHNKEKIEFSHELLGEYLCAQAIAAKLKLLTQCQENAYSEVSFVHDASSVAQQLYNLLGYGILSEEITELLIENWRPEQKPEFDVEVIYDTPFGRMSQTKDEPHIARTKLLSERLLAFWDAYCRGRWLDEGIAHQAFSYFQSLNNPVNVEIVNATVGLNVFLLLCAFLREAKLTFSPCGNYANKAKFNPEALLTLIGKTAVLSKSAFINRVLKNSLTMLNLSGAYLPQVMLAGANLEKTNLSQTELMGVNLIGANLTGANLKGANLTNANLTNANLTDANLTGANLTGANLTRVSLENTNLTNTCMFGAIITDADKEIATHNGAVFSLEQFQAIKDLLSPECLISVINSSTDTAVWLNNSPEIGLIESVEGEMILPCDLDDYYTNDETVFTN